MQKIKTTLGECWEALNRITAKYNFKEIKGLDPTSAESLIQEIDAIEKHLAKAKKKVATFISAELFAIGRETAPGVEEQYEQPFLLGPSPDQAGVLAYQPSVDDALIHITTGNGTVSYATVAIFTGTEWEFTEDAPTKEAVV
jgi:hypothetical protein